MGRLFPGTRVFSIEFCINKEKQIQKVWFVGEYQESRVMNMWTVAADEI